MPIAEQTEINYNNKTNNKTVKRNYLFITTHHKSFETNLMFSEI